MFARARLSALRSLLYVASDQKEKKNHDINLSQVSPLKGILICEIFFLCWFKRKEGDLVYAKLAEFDHEIDATKPPKPPSYEPTVYADVEVPDSLQPTYGNLETTGVWMK